MSKAIKKLAAVSCAAVLLFCNCLAAFAEVRLPEGTVAGLPEKLTALDSDGNPVNSSTGEYFFEVEDMKPFETYTKDIQIMNLREDKAYHIYFYAEPISNEGEIDLEKDCEAVFNLDGDEVFRGKVTGEPKGGYADMSEEPVDLGLYEPGKSRKLTAEVTWNGEGAGDFIDYGSRLVDTEGTHILREKSGDNYIHGETKFRWIFYAVVDENYVPPNTGVLAFGGGVYAAVIAVGMVAIAVLCFLIFKKKRKDNKCKS
ncbi:MAG: hypothetical protein ACI4JW_07690 [Oscillospiraceae bacterium]